MIFSRFPSLLVCGQHYASLLSIVETFQRCYFFCSLGRPALLLQTCFVHPFSCLLPGVSLGSPSHCDLLLFALCRLASVCFQLVLNKHSLCPQILSLEHALACLLDWVSSSTVFLSLACTFFMFLITFLSLPISLDIISSPTRPFFFRSRYSIILSLDTIAFARYRKRPFICSLHLFCLFSFFFFSALFA